MATNILSAGLSPDYGLVALAASSTFFLNLYQTILVAKARKAAKIEYPQLYAERAEAAANKDAYKFNCAQRAHQNTLEVQPSVLFGLMFGGLRYPKLAASLGFTWLVGRFVYTYFYASGEPKKRNYGGFHALAFLGIMGTSIYSAWELYMGRW